MATEYSEFVGKTEHKIKTRVNELITDYITACGGQEICWINCNAFASTQRPASDMLILTAEEDIFLDDWQDAELDDSVFVNLFHSVLKKARLLADPNGKAIIWNIRGSIVADGYDENDMHAVLTVSISGVSAQIDAKINAEIKDAYRRLGNRFEPFDKQN